VRRDFISNLSHELRTPLASLKALTETLQDGALDDPPAASRFIDHIQIEVDALTQMVTELLELSRIESGDITGASGKKVFAAMFETGKSAEEIISAEGLAQIQDTREIERLCREVIAKNPDNVAKYRAGNEGVFKFFVGQVIRASRGQANPQLVNDTLKRLLQ